jgi:lipopolysaccharide transport system ATP-binding protein
VGSLLEVGAGFHPELTGRENVYLNGVILGMTKKEIDRNFDEIVHFAEVEKFIDTPVKRYSSGMHMRLAFSVAAHLESEILMVDEVLAVGDVLFQRKCLGKMGSVARQGRTVLFVSHNMGTVRSLCTRGLCLNDGRVIYDGPIADCIESYFRTIGAFQPANGDSREASSEGSSCFGRMSVCGSSDNTVYFSDPLELSTTLRIGEDVSGFSIHCILEDMHGRRVFRIREDSKSIGLRLTAPGCYQVRVALPPLWLAPGMYTVYFKVKFWGAYGPSKQVSDRFPLDVNGANTAADSVLHPQARWSIGPIS